MSTLKAQVREASAKGKQLRREGVIPAVLFGKHLDESISIQIPKGDVEVFLRTNPIGSKLDLVIGKKKYMALFKNITFTPIIKAVEHISFLEMTAGEKVASEFHIHLHNRAKVDGIVLQSLSQVHYRAIPSKLIDTVSVELEGKKVGDSATLGDLDFVNNPDIEILTPLDTPVYSISPRITAAAEALAESEAADAAEASAASTEAAAAAEEEKSE